MRRRRTTGSPPKRRRRAGACGSLIVATAIVWSGASASTTLAGGKGGSPARASAGAVTELSLEQRTKSPRYGGTLVLAAKLTSAGKPLPARSISLHSGPTALAVGTTDATGEATFQLDVTGNQTYEARFGATAPADLVAYQPSTSKPLAVVVEPIVKLRLSSPLRAGRRVVGVPGVRVRVKGRVVPYVGGGQVTVRVTRRGREIKRGSSSVTKSASGGRFGLTFKLPRRGTYLVSAVQGASAGLGSGRSKPKRLYVVRTHAGPGARGTAVRALQRRLKTLGYVTPVNGHFGGSTSRAVLAFRKVFGMSRVSVANRAVFRKLAKGGGRFRVRYPKAGRHIEFDWSRQVLVLARGSRPVKVLHASSGAPSTPTVFGSFRFYSKTPGYNSKGMYYSSYFIGGYAIHGYSPVPTYPASHGCIRIPIPSATSVYRWIRLGTRISVYK